MRKEKTLTAVLKGLADLLAREASRNPEFAAELEHLLHANAGTSHARTERASSAHAGALPDVHEEWDARGETGFRIWLRDQPVLTIRAIIRAEDLDATRRTVKWKDAEKLADFASDGLRARLSRGSAFLRSADEHETK